MDWFLYDIRLRHERVNIRLEILLKLKPARFVFSTFKLTSVYTDFSLGTITPSIDFRYKILKHY